MTSSDIVQKLWGLCDVLRDDGINYSDYVTELVLLLFIKMEHENVKAGVLDKSLLPKEARWAYLSKLGGVDLLKAYRQALLTLSESRDAIEEVIEPYLLQQGLIQRTPRGRMLGATGWRHLGLEMPRTAQAGLFEE